MVVPASKGKSSGKPKAPDMEEEPDFEESDDEYNQFADDME